jgi:hypothetical protein
MITKIETQTFNVSRDEPAMVKASAVVQSRKYVSQLEIRECPTVDMLKEAEKRVRWAVVDHLYGDIEHVLVRTMGELRRRRYLSGQAVIGDEDDPIEKLVANTLKRIEALREKDLP